MSQTFSIAISVVGIDIGKNSFHVVGLDERGAIMLRQKWSRGQVEARFANMPSCLVGMEACVGAISFTPPSAVNSASCIFKYDAGYAEITEQMIIQPRLVLAPEYGS